MKIENRSIDGCCELQVELRDFATILPWRATLDASRLAHVEIVVPSHGVSPLLDARDSVSSQKEKRRNSKMGRAR